MKSVKIMVKSLVLAVLFSQATAQAGLWHDCTTWLKNNATRIIAAASIISITTFIMLLRNAAHGLAQNKARAHKEDLDYIKQKQKEQDQQRQKIKDEIQTFMQSHLVSENTQHKYFQLPDCTIYQDAHQYNRFARCSNKDYFIYCVKTPDAYLAEKPSYDDSNQELRLFCRFLIGLTNSKLKLGTCKSLKIPAFEMNHATTFAFDLNVHPAEDNSDISLPGDNFSINDSYTLWVVSKKESKIVFAANIDKKNWLKI